MDPSNSLSLPNVIFVASLSIGLVTDVRSRRVPNLLVGWLMLMGLIGALMHWSLAESVTDAVLASGAGLAIWLPFWLLGLLGAGDVKYFAAASAWIGVTLTWHAAVAAALLGGVLGVLVLVYQRGIRHTTSAIALQYRHARDLIANADAGSADAAHRTFPYAVPMGAAIAFAAFYPAALRNL